MDVLKNYINDHKLNQENILSCIDEYSLYCFYIGQELEVGVAYSSPLRERDDQPSFALFTSNKTGELMFKDHGLNLSGNVFVFLCTYLALEMHEVYLQINSDLQLGLGEKKVIEQYKPVVVKKTPIIKEKSIIRITSQEPTKKFIEYWTLLDISQKTLDIFYARDTAVIHFISKSHHKIIVPKTVCTSYEIYGYYKVYQPYNKDFKFVNNYPMGYVEGAIQLRWNLPFVIITKSTKECMFFREHFDWDSVAGTSESATINKQFMAKLFKAYPTVFIWLDNDAAGERAQAKYLEKYPQLIPIVMNKGLVAKDVTDLYLLYKRQGRKEDVLKYTRKLINIHLSNEEQ